MKKIIHIAKTDINTDGRILNEFQIIKQNLANVEVQLILLPDRKLKIDTTSFLNKVHIIDCFVRNNRVLRPFVVIEFTLKVFRILRKEKPDLIHAQDNAVSLPVLFYKKFGDPNCKILYDDHEIANENSNLLSRINHFFENKLLKKSDFVLFANEERLEHIRNKLVFSGKVDYLLNLPYYSLKNDKSKKTSDVQNLLDLRRLQNQIDKGVRFIIHQGILHKERGVEKLAEFSKILPENYKILLIGGNQLDFEQFLKNYNLERERFYFVGTVNYSILSEFWDKGIASIIMYLPTYINNRLCAPNRLYLSFQKGLPLIINQDNPVLFNFITYYNCGITIESLNQTNINAHLNSLTKYDSQEYNRLVYNEVEKFLKIYTKILEIEHPLLNND